MALWTLPVLSLLLIVLDSNNVQSRSGLPSLGKCIAPAKPKNGDYFINHDAVNVGDLVNEFSIITYQCNKGYSIDGPDVIYCRPNGTWSGAMNCSSLCEPLHSLTLDLSCSFNDKFINCNKPMQSGAFVHSKCKHNHRRNDAKKPKSSKCVGGKWNNVISECSPRYSDDTITARNSRNCFAPPNLQNGNYLINDKNVTVHLRFSPYSVLTYNCDDAYSKSGCDILYCRPNGTWSGTMECLKLCDPPQSLTVDFICALGGEYVNCSKPIKNGTVVKLKCKPHHTTYTNTKLNTLTCVNGEWDSVLSECTPDCGQETGVGSPYIYGGKPADREFSPWHVGIYILKKQGFEQICGGTIITRNIVISAAHCFESPEYVDLYSVTAGKIYRQWDHDEKNKYDFIQYSSVKKIHIPSSYRGPRDYYQQDIAILLLKIPFEFSNEIHAACLNLNEGRFYENMIASNVEGKVVGWGITDKDDPNSASKKLLRADIKIINRDQCLRTIPDEFIPYVTSNKICINGAEKNMTICIGDSGGGTLVKANDISMNPRWYLIGVISAGALWGTLRNTCLANSSTSVSSLYDNRIFILDALYNYDRYSEFVGPTTTAIMNTTTPKPKITVECVLPPYPEHGKYYVVGKDKLFPGDKVSVSAILNYTCQVDYILIGPQNILCTESGTWTDSVQCDKSCEPLQSLTVDFECTNRGEFINCDEALPNGTTVTTSCKAYHMPTLERNLKVLSCKNGVWDELPPRCRPDFGQISEGTGLIISGQEVIKGFSPWHVGIYSLDKNLKKVFSQICGGTIISRNIVISAAHCFDNRGVIQNVSNYAVAAGKYYRDWDHEHDRNKPYVQKSKIEKIHIPSRYGGFDFNFQEDLAVLILEAPFDFNNMVMAVGIDLTDEKFNSFQLAPNNIGNVVGWGVTNAGDPSSLSPQLKLVELPVVEYRKCFERLSEQFHRFLTSDKFCAGFLDKGTTVCNGDSGGGIVFKSIEIGVTRWYIRGVVSFGDLDESRTTCRLNSYTLFTSIFSHNMFLTKIIEQYL
ncbi:ovochymase-like isoform X2 [Arctopsyche grandis]|uniref:ovochymase-like isoform X2 n=1 Tax=Arctopsyche grandis TaxID=121162 RepID=UPI00406D9AA6